MNDTLSGMSSIPLYLSLRIKAASPLHARSLGGFCLQFRLRSERQVVAVALDMAPVFTQGRTFEFFDNEGALSGVRQGCGRGRFPLRRKERALHFNGGTPTQLLLLRRLLVIANCPSEREVRLVSVDAEERLI